MEINRRHKRERAHEGNLLPEENKVRDVSGHRKKPTEGGTLTPWRRNMEGLVKAWKETEQARRTHNLETADGRTCQNTERNQLSKAHSPTEDSRGRDSSGHGKTPTKQGALTSWRQQRERLVRTREETNQARCTHQLETAKGGSFQDTERD